MRVCGPPTFCRAFLVDRLLSSSCQATPSGQAVSYVLASVSLGNSVGFEGIRFRLQKLSARYLHAHMELQLQFNCFNPLLLHHTSARSAAVLQLFTALYYTTQNSRL